MSDHWLFAECIGKKLCTESINLVVADWLCAAPACTGMGGPCHTGCRYGRNGTTTNKSDVYLSCGRFLWLSLVRVQPLELSAAGLGYWLGDEKDTDPPLDGPSAIERMLGTYALGT